MNPVDFYKHLAGVYREQAERLAGYAADARKAGGKVLASHLDGMARRERALADHAIKQAARHA